MGQFAPPSPKLQEEVPDRPAPLPQSGAEMPEFGPEFLDELFAAANIPWLDVHPGLSEPLVPAVKRPMPMPVDELFEPTECLRDRLPVVEPHSDNHLDAS
jgi:hypothetical protein